MNRFISEIIRPSSCGFFLDSDSTTRNLKRVFFEHLYRNCKKGGKTIMISQSLTLQVPEHIYRRLQRVAQTTRQPMEAVAYQSLQGNLPPLIEDIPDEWRGDLIEFDQLDDDALWKISQEPFAKEQWTHHQDLLERHQDGVLTDDERSELTRLRTAADRFVFRRSYALALLKWRGHAIFSEMPNVS